MGQPLRLGGFRHVQRNTIDTIREATLSFSRTPDFKGPLATVRVKHEDKPGATTFARFAPVRARYVRWQVTAIAPGGSPNVGGQRIEFFVAGAAEASPRGIGIETKTAHVIERKAGALTRSMKLMLDYPYAKPVRAIIRVEGQPSRAVELNFGRQTFEYTTAAMETSQTVNVTVDVGGESVAAKPVTIPPARTLTVYLLPHSHHDIGYTAIQTDIEEKQINNLLEGMAAAHRTADYPEGARFVWNVEVLWGAGSSPAAAVVQRARGIPRRGPKRAAWLERDVPQRTDRSLPAGGTRAALPIRHRVRPTLPYGGGLGNDQRCAGLYVGYGYGNDSGWNSLLFRGDKLLRPHRHDHGRMGKQALLVDRSGRQEQGAGLDPVLGVRHVAPLRPDVAGARCRFLRRPREPQLSLRHCLRPMVRPRRQRRSRSGDLRFRQRVERNARLSTVHHLLDQRGIPRL